MIVCGAGNGGTVCGNGSSCFLLYHILHKGVPRVASGTASQPLCAFVFTFGADINGFCSFHGASLNDGTLSIIIHDFFEKIKRERPLFQNIP